MGWDLKGLLILRNMGYIDNEYFDVMEEIELWVMGVFGLWLGV